MTSERSAATNRVGWSRVLMVSLPYLILYIGSIVLIAMTDSDPAKAIEYWKYFMPLVALVSIAGGWRYSGATGKDKAAYIGKQLLHWGVVLLGIVLLFMGDAQHFLNAESHGFVVAYVLGLGALLSGIYLDWKMALYGAFLIASALGIAFLDDNAVMLSIGAVVIAGIAMALMLRRRGRA
jgi:hypothetical protein